MNYRMVASAIVLAGVVQALPVGPGSATAQSQATSGNTTKWTVGRTAWGDPDLQGKWMAAETGTPMERPREFGGRELLTDKELADRMAALSKRVPVNDSDDAAFPEIKKTAPAHEKGIRGEEYNRFWVDSGPSRLTPWRRTSLVIDPPDGRIPALTPEGVKRIEAREAARRVRGEADGWEDRNLSERCLLTAFVRFAGSGSGSIRQILQAPGFVTIIVATLNSNEPIVIPVDGRPRRADNVRAWLGISRGRWDGNTLVVETTNINDQQDGGRIMPSRLPYAMPGGSHLGPGDTVRLIERFTRVGADLVEYSYTIEDPETYVRPYTVLRPLTKERDDLLMPENGCHEGNYGIVGQLSAGRADEAYALRASRAEAEARQPQLQDMKRKTEEWMKSRDKR